MEATTDRLALGNLKVNLRMAEIDVTETKENITRLTADLLEKETQFAKR